MALDKTDLAFKKLVNRKFTSPVRTFYEELGVTTLEIDVGGFTQIQFHLQPLPHTLRWSREKLNVY